MQFVKKKLITLKQFQDSRLDARYWREKASTTLLKRLLVGKWVEPVVEDAVLIGWIVRVNWLGRESRFVVEVGAQTRVERFRITPITNIVFAFSESTEEHGHDDVDSLVPIGREGLKRWIDAVCLRIGEDFRRDAEKICSYLSSEAETGTDCNSLGLLLRGPCGIGKSRLVRAVVESLSEGAAVKWIACGEFDKTEELLGMSSSSSSYGGEFGSSLEYRLIRTIEESGEGGGMLTRRRNALLLTTSTREKEES